MHLATGRSSSAPRILLFGFLILLSPAYCSRSEIPPAGHMRRVVTLAPNVTELVFWLGCGDRIVATDDFSNFPEPAKRLPKVGGMHPSLEKIALYRPELVIGSSSADQSDVARGLAPLGISFEILKTDRVSDIVPAAARVAALLHCGAPARARISSFAAALRAVRRVRARKPRILFAVWPNPLYVAAHHTFADDLILLAGGENAVAATVGGWPQYSMEAVVANPPDLLLFPTRQMTQEQLRALLESDPIWKNLSFVREKRFFVVDEDLFTRPGPRFVSAVASLNELLDREGFQ